MSFCGTAPMRDVEVEGQLSLDRQISAGYFGGNDECRRRRSAVGLSGERYRRKSLINDNKRRFQTKGKHVYQLRTAPEWVRRRPLISTC
jgi:hypothetical protein